MCCKGGTPTPTAAVNNRRVGVQIILVQDVQSVGKEGELMTVPIGFWRNYLQPNRLARIASDGILE